MAMSVLLLVSTGPGCQQQAATGASEGRLRISLDVVRDSGVRGPEGLPVSVGVPFPDDTVHDPEGLSLQTTGGAVIPAQMEVRSRYPSTGAIRWLGVDFSLDPDLDRYELVENGPPPTIREPIEITEDRDVLLVDTGPLRVEIPRRGGMLRRAWVDGELVLTQEATNELIRHADGVRFRDADPSASDGLSATIETFGPLHAVVRVEGDYVAASGERLCRWMARLHFYAGQPVVRIAHTFVWTGTAEELQIRRMGLRFELADAAQRTWVDRASDAADGAHDVSLSEGEAVSLLQDEHWHWGHGRSHFAVRAGQNDDPRTLSEGERAGSWVAASTGKAGVLLVLRDLWQMYPKELRATTSGLQARLWSDGGNAPIMDLRLSAMERWWGPKMGAQLASRRWAERHRLLREEPRRLDPTGLARTHDLLLRFFLEPADPDELEAWADGFDREPRVVADPEWTTSTGVLGLLGAQSEAHPEIEATIEQVWRDVGALVREWGDYGFLSFGDGPHYEYELIEGHAVASRWRYGGMEYGYGKAAWLAFLRTGNRRIFDLARTHSRFLNDLVLAHEESRSRRRGDWLWQPDGTLLPWEGTHRPVGDDDPRPIWLGHRRGFGFFIEHALLAYAVTGDRWALDVTREYKNALIAWIADQPDWPRRYIDDLISNHSRWAFQRLDELTTLYLQFGDPELLEHARALASALLDPSNPSGLRAEPETKGGEVGDAPSYLFYKGPALANARRAFHGVMRDRIDEALLRTARHALRTGSTETRSVGLRMAHGLNAGGSPLMLAFAEKRIAARRAQILGEPKGHSDYRTRLTAVPAVAWHTMTNEGHLLRALKAFDAPQEPFPAVWKSRGSPSADLVLQKSQGIALEAEVSAQNPEFIRPDGSAWSPAWLAEPIKYWAWRQGEPWTYSKLRLPPEAPAGAYRIRVDDRAGAQVLDTDASRRGLIAPDGFDLGAGVEAPWYFELPKGTDSFALWASNPEQLELRDESGQRVPLPPIEDCPVRIEAGNGESERRWSARALASTNLAIFDLPPVFAYGDASFLPNIDDNTVSSTSSSTSPETGFTEGHRAQGLRLTERDGFLIRPAQGNSLPVDRTEGTVEFFLRPDWHAGRLTHGTFRGLLHLAGTRGGGIWFYYGHGLRSRDQKPYWDVRAQLSTPSGVNAKHWLIRNSDQLRWTPTGAWVHVAWVWAPNEQGDARDWTLFVDGHYDPKRQGLGPPLDEVLPGALAAIEIGGPSQRRAESLHGVVDDVRISSIARYTGDPHENFVVPQDLPVDDATIAVFRLDGDLSTEGPRAGEVKGTIRSDR